MKLLDQFKRFIFPNFCSICGTIIETEEFGCICAVCWRKIRLIPPPRCIKCGKNTPGKIENNICADCLKKRTYYDEIFAAAHYDDQMKQIIHLFKFKGRWGLKKYLAALIFENGRHMLDNADMLVPVPLHYSRARRRGYNQSAELAGELSKRCGVPVKENILYRKKETLPQSTLEKSARLTNISNAFILGRNAKSVKGKNIVIVDDVFTSGSTINEAARMLRLVEPAGIKAIAVAHGV